MPYRRRYRRRRRRRPTRGQNYRAGLGQLWRDVKTIKNMVNVEYKAHDNDNSTTPSSSGSLILLNGISQGDGESNRDGVQVRYKSCEHSVVVSQHTSATQTILRWLLFIDLQPDGSTPGMSEVLDTSSAPAYMAARNLDNRSRFLILKDKSFAMSSTGTRMHAWKYFRKLDLKTLYTGTGSLIGNIKNHSLFLLLVSSEATNTPTVVYHNRLRFIDN